MIRRNGWLVCAFFAFAFTAYGQNSVGIGVANPNKNAVLELISPGHNQGILIPKLTTIQRTASAFTNALSATENGLMVFDSNENKFYYWEVNQWKALGTGSELTGGNGISIVNNTVSTIPQDIQLSGSTLTVTNNPGAVPINLSALNIPQDLQVTGSTLTVTNNPGAVPINLSALNIPQDLQLSGSTLTITNNASATPINLSAFTGTNTDDQALTYTAGSGELSISRLSGGPQSVTIPTTFPPSGGASGDLTGSYPNPTVANNVINSAKIADGTVAGADIAGLAVTNTHLANNAVTSLKIADLSIVDADVNATANLAVTKLAAGTTSQVLTTTAGGIAWVNPTAAGTAGGDLTGTFPNPQIANNAVASAEITDASIVDADVNATANLAVTKLAAGTTSQVLTTTAGGIAWVNPTAAGTAGGDLTGTFPNPQIANLAVVNAHLANNAVTSLKIADLSIVDADVNATANLAVTKLAAGAVNQVLTTTGTGIAWTAAPTATGTAGGDLTGTFPNPQIANLAVVNAHLANSAVSSAKIADNSIVDADVNATANLAVTKLAAGTTNQVLTTTAGGIAWANAPTATGAAGGDLSGTFPNPQIANLTIVDGDISNSANINVSKLAVGSNGQVLTTSGTTALWANPSGSVLLNNTGTRNLHAGFNVGGPLNGTTGTDNVFYGYQAGNAATSGSWNVVVGADAGRNNVSGNLNTLIGWVAGGAIALPTFNGNTFVGAQAGQNATSGPSTFIGEKAGQANTSGTQNLFAGNEAGNTNTIGAQNTILGYFADVSTGILNNATAIGYNAIVNDNNKVRIGNAAVTVIEGQVAFTALSDRRKKTNIQPLENGLGIIMKMKPMSYNMKNSNDNRLNWGFIAQDVEELVGPTNAVVTVSPDKDRSLGLRYTDFIAPLVKAVQEQQDQISDLSEQLTESEKKVDLLIAEIEKLKKAVGLKAENK